ncbi:MAG: hypothetical protein ACTSQY_00790 [Candidatus Odinarchaeia archaeon]
MKIKEKIEKFKKINNQDLLRLQKSLQSLVDLDESFFDLSIEEVLNLAETEISVRVENFLRK